MPFVLQTQTLLTPLLNIYNLCRLAWPGLAELTYTLSHRPAVGVYAVRWLSISQLYAAFWISKNRKRKKKQTINDRQFVIPTNQWQVFLDLEYLTFEFCNRKNNDWNTGGLKFRAPCCVVHKFSRSLSYIK